MCYYLNVHFQGQRVNYNKRQPTDKNIIRAAQVRFDLWAQELNIPEVRSVKTRLIYYPL